MLEQQPLPPGAIVSAVSQQGGSMRVSRMALGLTLGILWGCALGIIGVLHVLIPPYGEQFFEFMASVYPGITGSGSLLDILLGVLYGLVDGFLGGWLIAWLYNVLAQRLARQ